MATDPRADLLSVLSETKLDSFKEALGRIYTRSNINIMKTRGVFRWSTFSSEKHLPEITAASDVNDDYYRFIEMLKLDTDKKGDASQYFIFKDRFKDIITGKAHDKITITISHFEKDPRYTEIAAFLNKFKQKVTSAAAGAGAPSSGLTTANWPVPPRTVVDALSTYIASIDSDDKLELFIRGCNSFNLLVDLIFYSQKITAGTGMTKDPGAQCASAAGKDPSSYVFGDTTWKKIQAIPAAIEKMRTPTVPIMIELDDGREVEMPAVPRPDLDPAINRTLMGYINTYVGRYCVKYFTDKIVPRGIVKYKFFYLLLIDYLSILTDSTKRSLIQLSCVPVRGGRRRHTARRRSHQNRKTKLRRRK
jgi:hypothetical protein